MFKDNSQKRLLEVVQKLDARDKSKLNENFEQVEEFVPHGSYTVSNSGGYEVMLNDAGDAARVRDAYGSDNPQTSDWLEIEYIPNEEGESEPVIDPQGYNIPLNQVMRMQETKEIKEDLGGRFDIQHSLTNDDTRDISINIVDKLVASGIVPDDMNTDNENEFNTQDIIHEILNQVFNIQNQ